MMFSSSVMLRPPASKTAAIFHAIALTAALIVLANAYQQPDDFASQAPPIKLLSQYFR